MRIRGKVNPFSVGLAAYQVGLALSVAALFVGLLSSHSHLGVWWAVAGLGVVAAIAERGKVRVVHKIDLSISLVPTVFAAAVFGPLSALVVGAMSYAGEMPLLFDREQRLAARELGAPWAKWRVFLFSRTLSGGIAGIAASAGESAATGRVSRVVVATVVAAVVAEAVDVAVCAVTASFRGRSAMASLKALVPIAVMTIPLYVPLVALLGVAYRDVTPWTLALFFVPALAAQRLYALYQRQRELAEGLASLNTALEQANLSFASALVATLDARDRYTAGHSAAVAIYARDIAKRMGLSEREQRLANLCGLVHDIGKIGLPAGLLEKPGALTLDERREMQRHSEIGERILTNVETYAEIAAVVRHHHERMDGHGYPDGLHHEEIPLLARIISVADAYNAMTSDRPYRDAMPTRVARLRLAQAVESQFDTSVVAAFEAILAGATEEYRQAKGKEFLWLQDDVDLESAPVPFSLHALPIAN